MPYDPNFDWSAGARQFERGVGSWQMPSDSAARSALLHGETQAALARQRTEPPRWQAPAQAAPYARYEATSNRPDGASNGIRISADWFWNLGGIALGLLIGIIADHLH